MAAGEYGKAEQARLEAYAFFEFGPEQRLRGLAPELFVRIEGLFWYGEGDYAGLAQLIARKSALEEITATRSALDAALADSEAAVGSGPKSDGLRGHEHRDHRLPGRARGGADPGRSHRGHGGRPAAPPATAPARRRRRLVVASVVDLRRGADRAVSLSATARSSRRWSRSSRSRCCS